MAADLFDGSSSDDEDLARIEIDHEFARRLEHNKRREAQHRLKELKARGLASASEDDDDDDEDDDADLDLAGNPKQDLQIFDALVKLKNRDPILDQKDTKLFADEEEESEEKPNPKKKKKKEQAQYLKDVNAKHLLEHGPELSDDDDDEPLKHASRMIYSEEQKDQIKAFLEAEEEALGSDDDKEEFMKEKEKTEEEETWDEDTDEIETRIRDYFGEDEKMDVNELFLKNFLREKMWMDNGKDKSASFVDVDAVPLSEDSDIIEGQDEYETGYNFRHEEAAGDDRVWGHSRVVEGSVRKKSSSRKAQRKSKEERMKLAEYARKEELKHLKNLKKKEIQEKLEKVRAIAGIGEGGTCNLNADDLEEDFDPEEYDKKMREMFDTGYYEAEDVDPGFGSDAEGDLKKPDFDKEDELLGMSKDWDVGISDKGFAAARERMLKKKEKGDQEQQQPGEDKEEEHEEKESKRKKKRKISLKEKVELEKEMEEYYKLDYEDTIGDLKTRFKYRSVPANRFGLSAEEILVADDKNLNQFVSLKKLAPYRQNEWKINPHLKKKKGLILEGRKEDCKKSDKQHDFKESSSSRELEKKAEEEAANGEATMSRRSKRRRRQAELKISQSRLAAYGKIPAKPHKNH